MVLEILQGFIIIKNNFKTKNIKININIYLIKEK